MDAQKTRYPELSRITVDAIVVWLLAFVFAMCAKYVDMALCRRHP